MSKRRKASNGSGSFERRAGNVAWVRVSLPTAVPGAKPERRRLPIAGSERMNDAEARREAKKLARDVADGKIVFDAPVKSKAPAVGSILTNRQLGAKWTSGELFKAYGNVNRLKIKAGAKIDAWCLNAHAYEVRMPDGRAFGDLPVAETTEEHATLVMAAMPPEQRAETKIKQYNRLHRMFDLAIFPLRIRKDNPVTRYLRPSRDADKLFCFLYPAEVVALLRGTNAKAEVAVPIGRRMLYALGIYTGQRKGSLFALKWKHVDFDHGTLASFKTKTGAAQYFVADRGLMALLEAWDVYCGEPGDDEPIVPEDAVAYEPKRLATALRDDLHAVGVTRAILFEENELNVEPLRFHDLRSTFCTWSRRLGRSDAWISERTGHEPTGDMISRYDRGAQTLSDLQYAPFPDVSDAVPELAKIRATLATRLAKAPDPAKKLAAENVATSSTSVVGAIGFEPTTPTVSSEKTVPTTLSVVEQTHTYESPSAPSQPSKPVGNVVDNEADASLVSQCTDGGDETEALRARIAELERLVTALTSPKPTLKLVR